ncbi:hypothetical protein AKJ16_DCAP27496, partial [Drosera capensis]
IDLWPINVCLHKIDPVKQFQGSTAGVGPGQNPKPQFVDIQVLCLLLVFGLNVDILCGRHVSVPSIFRTEVELGQEPQASSGDSRSQAPVPNPQAALVQTQHADSSKPVAVLSGAQSGKGSVVSKPRTQSPPKKATGFMCAG